MWLDMTPDLSGRALISPYNVNSLSVRQVREERMPSKSKVFY